jgi:hypothetical protein
MRCPDRAKESINGIFVKVNCGLIRRQHLLLCISAWQFDISLTTVFWEFYRFIFHPKLKVERYIFEEITSRLASYTKEQETSKGTIRDLEALIVGASLSTLNLPVVNNIDIEDYW